MPNGFAYLALALWPLVSLFLFRTQPPGRAVIASILIAYLMLPPLPTAFDFPLIPPLTKETIPALSAFFFCMLFYGKRMSVLPSHPAARTLLLVFVFSPMATALTNGEPVVFGMYAIQPLGLKEGLAMCVQNALLAMPLVMAMNFLKTERDQRDVLMALLLGGLVYSLPMLLEVRLAPQLNIWVYGFFQHSFEQMMRGDGFRPIVFLYHGLWVAFFALTSILAAVSLFRGDVTRGKRNVKFLFAGAYMLAVLVLCKSLASLLYAMALVPVILFFSTRTQLRVALVLMLMAVIYPVLKGNNMVPERTLLQQAYQISPERAGSLLFRLENERILLERAERKPLLGWGSFGRNLIYGSDGRLLTVPDGRWVIVFGTYGWVGYLAEFGLLSLPLFLLLWRIRGVPTAALPPWLGGVALILAINMIDMLPNATLTPLTWLTAGALLGYAQTVRVQRRQTRLQSVM
ncbi:MAG: hypothetical protein LPK02_08270 [Rhodobacterales bacterium]|nr:hypothetical protein [Rhodobacterales bacterium]MDX5413027.1 hypothetical protein [Rhodobacterales bacterium]